MITITSSFTAEPIRYSLEFLIKKFTNINYEFFYDQIFQQLLVTHSTVRQNTHGLNVFLIRIADLISRNDPIKLSENLAEHIDELINAFKAVQPIIAPNLIVITPSFAQNIGEKNAFKAAEEKLFYALKAFKEKNFFIVSPKEIENLYPVKNIFNEIGDKYAHIPYSIEFYTALGAIIARKYYALIAKPYKVIVIDCDGTLWKGVIEEDGLEGITISAREKYLQNILLNQFNQGMLLCLCSKNNEKSVLSVFQQCPDMLIDIEKHIVSYRINWKKKSENIQSLSQELNLGLDSFIFIDDNPLECAEVQAACPAVLTIAVPQRLDQLKLLFNHIWALDHIIQTREDSKRTEMYKQNIQRDQLTSSSLSYLDFLNKLKLKLTIRKPSLADFPRISQLNQRTNQFNLNPNSINDEELLEKIKLKNGILVISAVDKFGDYGLVGVLGYEELEEEILVKIFLLSCRALGKGIEYKMLNKLANIAESKNISQLKIFFSVTERNYPAINFIKSIIKKEDLEIKDRYFLISIPECSAAHFDLIKKATEKPSLEIKGYPINFSANTSFLNSVLKNLKTVSEIISQLNKKNKKIEGLIQLNSPKKLIEFKFLQILEKYDLTLKSSDSSLIEAGLNSLKAALIAMEIYEAWKIDINYTDILDKNTTAHKLVEKISSKPTINNIEKEISDLNYEKDYYSLSFAQQRLWIDEQIEPDTSRNIITIALKIDSNADENLLNNCFKFLIARHDSFRFCFFSENESPYIKIKDIESFNINYINLFDMEEAEKEADRISQIPFNLNQPPLLRVTLFKIKSGEKILLLNIHHIIHDGWSLNILFKEISILYDSYLHQKNIHLKNSHAYKDFIIWQKNYFNQEKIDKQKKFWQGISRGFQILNFNYDFDDIKNTQENFRIEFKIDFTVAKKLMTICKETESTLFEVLLTSFEILLSVYTNQNEINLATATSGRHYPEIMDVIGIFVNLLVMQVEINNEDSFKNILDKNKIFINQAMLNQDLPYNQILNSISNESGIKSRSKIQAGFIFQNYPENPLILNGKASDIIFSNSLIYDKCKVCRFGNLVLYCQEKKGEINCIFEYNRNVFKHETALGMIEIFKNLLKNIAKNPNKPIFNIQLIDNRVKNTLLNKFNHHIIEYPESLNLIKIFKEQSNKFPKKLAVCHKNKRITYLELDKLSNQLSHHLQKLEIHSEDKIGIFLPKGLEWIISMLSIIKCGGCYVPLDIELPPPRLQQMIESANISIIITDPHLQLSRKIEHHSLRMILIHQENFPNEPIDDLDYSTIRKNNLAYVMYTSGSTGQPKGVMIEHQSIVRLVKNTNYIHISSRDNVAQTANLSFDAATLEIWGALLNGATLNIAPKDTILSVQEFSGFLTHNKITILFLTTQLFHMLASNSPNIFAHLKYLVVGGDTVMAESIKAVMSIPDRPKFFINGYGPTENTTFSTTYVLNRNENIQNPVPIGKPISGTRVYIFNSTLCLNPPNAPGRLFISGLGMTRGYLNQDSLKNKKFIRNPYQPNEILYDTGDIAAWLSDGNLRFLGRTDNQIKIHGHRVEIGEIESKLLTHSSVKQALVLLKEDNNQKKLMAFILIHSGKSTSEIDLYHYLKNHLPVYMVPTFYRFVEEFPLTTNGKIDKSALLKLPILTHINTYETPQNLIQHELSEIFSNVLNLNIETINIQTSFFELGGDSLLAIRLINDIYIKFLVKISFSSLYELSTIKLLSEHISDIRENIIKSINPINSLKSYDSFTLKQVKKGMKNKPPFIFIHPLGGTGFCYLDLIRHLPDDQPCFIIQDPSIDANRILFQDIPEMAAYYKQVILEKFDASLPVVLLGFSFGGMVCLEITHQLEKSAQSNRVSLLVILDTWIMSDVHNEHVRQAIKSNLLHQYDRIRNSLIEQQIDPKPWMELNYTRLQNLGFSYIPSQINKNILLFKAMDLSENFLEMQESTNYLKLHNTGHIEVCLVPGNHDTFLQKPNVQIIANRLKLLQNAVIID